MALKYAVSDLLIQSSLMTQLTKIHHSFLRSLQSYDQHAKMQSDIASQLHQYFLSELKNVEQFPSMDRVFEIGCGTGFLSKLMLDSLQIEQFYLNDLVAECEPFVRSILEQNQVNWQFIYGDIKKIDFPEKLNLVCSSSVLQWVQDVPALLARARQSMNDNAWFVVSSFTPNHFAEVRYVQQQLSQPYAELNYLDKDSWLKLLDADFEISSIQSSIHQKWFLSVADLLKHLRKTGVNGNARQQWNQSKMNAFCQVYEAHFQSEGKVSLSYAPIYIIARVQ